MKILAAIASLFRTMFARIDAALGTVAASVVLAGVATLAGLVATVWVLKLDTGVEVGVGIALLVYVALAVLVGIGVRRA